MKNFKNLYQNKIFSQLPGKAILVHPGLKDVLGKLNSAIWLSQILYWYDKGNKSNEIYKSRNNLEKETGLTEGQQILVENHLKKLGLIKITVKPGRPSLTNHITINFNVLEKLIRNVHETRTLEKRQTNTQNHSSTLVFTLHQRTQNTDNISEITQKNIQKDNNEMDKQGSGLSTFLANRKKRGI